MNVHSCRDLDKYFASTMYVVIAANDFTVVLSDLVIGSETTKLKPVAWQSA